MNFGGGFFVEGEYSGIGLVKQTKLKGRLCDVLYLTKRQDQIDFEFPKGIITSFIPKSVRLKYYESVIQRQQKQVILQTRAIEQLDKLLKEWKYRAFKICAYSDQIELGISDEHAKKNHAIVFYYKQIE